MSAGSGRIRHLVCRHPRRTGGADVDRHVVQQMCQHRERHFIGGPEVTGDNAPIFRALSAGVVEGKKADAILHELMTLPIEHRA